MIYRIRRYSAVEENLTAFHAFFHEHLLPVQLRHGARLVGRWQTDDHEVIAVWEYDDEAAYRKIDAAVRADPASVRAQDIRRGLGPLFTSKHESFARSTEFRPSDAPGECTSSTAHQDALYRSVPALRARAAIDHT